ncbi:MAG TPA: hypothetical protein DD618_02605 [Acholeplasmatales bacterium]|nr:hypothetical protein [Acholeplasmatales bacterium]
MFLALDNSVLALIILAVCVLPIIVLMIYAIIAALRKRSKLSKTQQGEILVSSDDSQKQLFFRLYGGRDNIASVSQEMSRLTVSVKDLTKVLIEELKEQDANGILLAGNTVKCSFGDRAPYIYELLKDFEQHHE